MCSYYARLPSDPAVPVLVALWAHAPDGLDVEGEARHILRKFVWRAFLTERYEASTNSRTFADYRLRSCLCLQVRTRSYQESLTTERILFRQWKTSDLQIGPRKETGSGERFCCFPSEGETSIWLTERPATRENLRSREYHDIFPVALFKESGKDSSRVSKALNCALGTWKTNLIISAQSPIQYLRHRINASSHMERTRSVGDSLATRLTMMFSRPETMVPLLPARS